MTHLARSPDALWRAVTNALIVATPEHSPIVVSGSAPAMWALLEEPCSRDQLAEDLAYVFGEQPEVIAATLRPVIEDLLKRGIMIEVD